MTTRMTVQRITFFRAFRLASTEGVYPAGSYHVETDEDPIEGLSFAAYRRRATYITVPGPGAGMTQMVRVEPADLDVLLNVALESALTRSRGAPVAEMQLDALMDDPLIQSAISSARLTTSEFRSMVDRVMHDRRGAAQEAAGSDGGHGGPWTSDRGPGS